MFFKLPVKKIMVTKPFSVTIDTTIKKAADVMRLNKIRSLLITKDNNFVGIVTDVDIVDKGFAKDQDVRTIPVEEIMTSPLLSVDEEESINNASNMMNQYHIRHLVVTKNDIPVGVVSARDLLDPVYVEEGGVPFWPNHLLKEVIAVFVMLCVLFTLVIFSPAPMEPPADQFSTPTHIKPEWFFLAAYQFLKVADVLKFISADAPKVLGVIFQGFVVVLLFALPFIDKNKERNPKKRKLAMFIGISSMIVFWVFTIWGHYS